MTNASSLALPPKAFVQPFLRVVELPTEVIDPDPDAGAAGGGSFSSSSNRDSDAAASDDYVQLATGTITVGSAVVSSVSVESSEDAKNLRIGNLRFRNPHF